MIKLANIFKPKETTDTQEILNAAYKKLENPIFIFNMEYELMAHSDGADNDDRICAEFMEHGKLGSETLEFFKNECFIDAVANCDGVTYLVSDKLKYDRVFGQLYNKKLSPVADLVIVACEKEFEPNTKELVKELCEKISNAFAKNEFYQIYGQTYQETIVKKLIEKSIENKGIYAGHVANIDNGLKDNIFVAIADAGQPNQSYDNLARLRNLFENACPQFKHFIYSNYIITLISSENKQFDMPKEFKKLRRLAKSKKIHIGISEGFENLFNMHIHYNQAMYALNSGLKDGNEFIFFFNDSVSAKQ